MFEPQLAEDPKGYIPSFDGCVIEPKWDGIRLLACKDNGRVSFYTRNGNLKTLPQIAKALEQLPDGTCLDGEAVCLKPVGSRIVCDWGGAQSGTSKGDDTLLTFVVFDLLKFNGIDSRLLPLSGRRDLLEQMFDTYHFEKVSLTPQEPASQRLHDYFVEVGFEGSVLKKVTAPYRAGRNGGWWKLKSVWTEDVIVTGYEPGTDVGTIFFSQYDAAGNLVVRGRCKALGGLHEHIQELIDRQQVIEIKHNGVMPTGGLRHPQFVRVRDDKPASECVR